MPTRRNPLFAPAIVVCLPIAVGCASEDAKPTATPEASTSSGVSSTTTNTAAPTSSSVQTSVDNPTPVPTPTGSSNPTSPATSPSSTSSTASNTVTETTTDVSPSPSSEPIAPSSDPAGASSSSEISSHEGVSSEPASGATASPGCGKGGRPNGGKIYVANESWLVFPESYDGSQPLPVLFGFHGCGSGNRGDASRTEYTDLTQNNVLGRDYVVAVPISSDSGGCWNYNTDVVRVKKLYDDLVANHCVDTSHVFATGHSSGAQFIVQLLAGNHSADAEHLNFRGVAPVAASAYNHSTSMAVMYIQNQNDTVRMSSGKDVVDDFVAANQCSQESSEYAGVDACQSDGTQVDPGCVEYSGCAVPTVWCSHNDPQYTNTGHGVPCFAAQAMDHFFKSL